MIKSLQIQWSLRTLTACLLVPVFLALSAPVSAERLTVRIFERGGKAPLAGVAVCLGTAASLTQFGARRTDVEGYVVFADVPRSPLVVTASMRGFMGRQERMRGSNESRMLVMSLPAGGGGVECPLARYPVADDTGGIALRSLRINGGAAVTASRVVVLDHTVTGQVNQYRASERPDFSGTAWRPYDAAPRFTLSPGQGTRTLYFQVRRHALIDGADIESRSRVLQDTIVLRH